MKSPNRIALLVTSALLLAPLASVAGVITSATAVLNVPTVVGGFGFGNTINQSGLSIGYTSGVTDFATYVASDPKHVGSNTPENYAASNTLPPNAVVDYDMGSAVSLLQLAFWQYPFATVGPILDFEVLTSNDTTFATSTLVGTFTAIDDGISIGLPGNSVQVFDLVDTSARYVRINVLTTASSSGFGWSELAFDVGAPVRVPEPATALLAGLGLLGVALARRRTRAATA